MADAAPEPDTQDPAASQGGVAAARRMAMLEEVWEGLSRSRKVLSSKYFYDTRGSELFVRITHLPEYYPTRTEWGLLERWSQELIHRYRPTTLLELGAGSARKTRLLLDAMEHREEGGTYIPQDVSGEFVEGTAAQVRAEYPHLTVTPLVGDLTHPLDPALVVPRPVLLALLGSTIGNFSDTQATEILQNVAEFLQPGDHFLLGTDLRPSPGKTKEELEAAYNDGQGVTALFNLNILRVLNRLLGADFDPEAFRHRAFYNEAEDRIEMHLEATSPQVVTIPDRGRVAFRAGESVRTEISRKYDRPSVEALFRSAGLRVVEWLTDDRERYALAVGGPS